MFSLDGRIIDFEKRQRVQVIYPHRFGMAFEEKPEIMVALTDACAH